MTQECRETSPDNHRKAVSLYKACLHHKKGKLLCKPWGHFCFIEIELVEGLLDLFK